MENYCISRFNCVRLKTREVLAGGLGIGGDNPIRIQSMTNTKTMDVKASVAQCIQLAEAGCEIIRLTAQNLDAAKALKDISKGFRAAGFQNPLVADIHFLPATAMEAVEHVEKIRVNPGNFSDKKKTALVEYTDSQYAEELDRVREKFAPLVKRCKELGRAMRIGTNHGSLSDRIISRYGDTPLGMVEAALEFARICRDLSYNNFVFSFKASNTKIMTATYRLAVKKMRAEGFDNPLHLGVTEAGFGLDARIKSAIGIAGLLADGVGDTIRVSLTEDPVEEVPVAMEFVKIAERLRAEKACPQIDEGLDFFSYSRRKSGAVEINGVKVGGDSVPSVAVFGKSQNAEFNFDSDGKCSGFKFAKPASAQELLNELSSAEAVAAEIPADLLPEFAGAIRGAGGKIVVCPSAPQGGRHAVGEARALAAGLKKLSIACPVWLKFDASKCVFPKGSEESKLNEASAYIGSLLADGIGDIASVEISANPERNAELALAILQGARARKSKAEYVACPSCGRTLYNIQETAAAIKARTQHLKGLTIGIMGCIVNGPGEMSDADFGYVGGAPGKINLYKNKTCVKANIPQEQAIEKLIELIKESGKWVEP
ncbi:MAG: (E)-4-hydroxy-3-methylbut-2-enyl-diphosphate synthase [Opitutales bacterium]|nr:(E)-4-hydroxy-3-methylbut-2-enyl-diphosphate synthase [Opitutales bacterium]